jgi:glucose/arabinose dehydrogenase
LTGAPFAEGTANVYRVLPGVSTQIFRSGFKTIIDIAFGPDGSLYVLQYATGAVFFSGPGQIIRVTPDGTPQVIISDLVQPTSLAIDADGVLYVTNNGTSVGNGQVLRIQP